MRLGAGWKAGVYGSVGLYQSSSAEDPGYGGAAGLLFEHRFSPEANVSPSLGVGLGWRGHYVTQQHLRQSLLGLDLLRLQVGLDAKVAPGIRLAPTLAATLTGLFWQDPGSGTGYSDIQHPGLTVFLFAGVRGQFDLLDRS
ncbi:MAG: hypothetical protein QM765_47205 [Myxococcales bacterium]